VVDIIEVGKIGIYFQDPVRLGQNDSSDIEEADFAGKEGFALHPRNDIMHAPADVEEDCGG
jgi:hypothetical protein